MSAATESTNPLIPPVYDLVWTLVFVVLVVAVVAVVCVVLVRSRRRHRSRPIRSTGDRLAELDDLHRRGVITDDEHRTGRAEALRA